MTRHIFVDTEWTAPPWSEQAELMWIGLADETGRSWYGISAEVDIDPANNAFISGAFRLIRPDEPRLTHQELREAILDFCGDVDQFWAWIPTLESFSAWFGLGEEAGEIYAKCHDYDLQMLQLVVQPWPETWPTTIHNLCSTATEAGVPIPPRAENHLHPRVHAEWNQKLFELIQNSKANHL